MEGITVLSFLSILVMGCHGITVNTAPSNQTGIVNTNVTLICDVTKTSSENLFWKRVEGLTTTLIGYNELSKNTTKYAITGQYNLTVLDVQVADEGFYECEAGTNKPKAYLQVGVPPALSNMTISWVGVTEPVPASQELKIECKVKYSRPPAIIRWYKGNTDVTSNVDSYTAGTPDSAGYGDATSILKITLTPDDQAAPLYCKVDLADKKDVVTKMYRVSLLNGAGHLAASYLALVIFAALKIV